MADPESARQIQALRDEMAKYQRDQDYLQNVAGMRRAWEKDIVDNLDSTHPILIRTYISPLTRQIQRALLNISLLNFRAYETGAASANLGTLTISANTTGASSSTTTGPSVTTTSGPSSSSTTGETAHYHADEGATNDADGSVGLHSHYVSIHNTYTSGAHSHGMSHTHEIPSHTHTLDHTHDMSHGHTIGSHVHGMVFGIYESTAAADVTVIINGSDRTAALGGPFNADQAELDITQYLTATGYNTIVLGSSALGRIYVSLYLEIYKP